MGQTAPQVPVIRDAEMSHPVGKWTDSEMPGERRVGTEAELRGWSCEELWEAEEEELR